MNPFTDHATHLGASSRTDLRTSLIILVNAFSAAHVPMYKVEIRAQDEGETRRKFTFIHFYQTSACQGTDSTLVDESS